MESKLLTEIALAIREGSLEGRQTLLLAVAAAQAASTGTTPSVGVRRPPSLQDRGK
jgi:hypothetical protein